MLIISGMKLILSGRQVAEVLNKEKETLRYSFTGLLFILIADQVLRIFFGTQGEIYRTSSDMQLAAQTGVNFANGAASLLRVFIPSLAVLFLIIACFNLLMSRGDTAKMEKAKKQAIWAVMGLVLAGLAEVIVYQVIFPNTGTSIPDTQAFAKLAVSITNFVAGFISTVAALMLIYAGYLYVISLGGGGMEKAKKIAFSAIIGLLIAMAAFALVNTFIRITPDADTTATTQNIAPSGT